MKFIIPLLLFCLSLRAQSIDPNIDVKRWEALGTRWAIGYDDKNEKTGIYDLSYSMPWTRVKIGSLSGPKVKLREIVGLIRDGEIEDSDKQLSEQAIKELSENSDKNLDRSLLPTNWKEQVPWKFSARTLNSSEFRLNDFDFEKSVKDVKKFQEELVNTQALLGDEFQDLFNQVQIVQVDDSFEIYFEPQANSFSDVSVSGPKKIVNLKNPKMSFLEALKLELLKKSIGKLTGFIINPIVKAFVDTALDRLFNFAKMANYTHQHMALEILGDLSDSDGLFPKGQLNENDLTHMAESLQYASSSLTSSYKWIWERPYKEWLKDRDDEVDFNGKSIQWLVDHKMAPSLLNSRFANVSQNLVLVSNEKPNKKKGPFTPYVEGQMSPYKGARVRTEILTTAVVFGTKFIPLVGGLLKDLFKRVVEKPTQKQRYWEARLTVHLEERAALNGEDWSTQLLSLDGQKVNPFLKNRKDTLALIELRRKALGLTN